jgi:hypothetical protein
MPPQGVGLKLRRRRTTRADVGGVFLSINVPEARSMFPASFFDFAQPVRDETWLLIG